LVNHLVLKITKSVSAARCTVCATSVPCQHCQPTVMQQSIQGLYLGRVFNNRYERIRS
jgi:deoxycytidylate deaminase